MKKIALILATGSLVAAGAAVAQTAAPRGDGPPATRAAVAERTEAMFARMDANGDGVLSEADKAARAAEHFARMDTNGDGMLSQAEFLAAREARADKRDERQAAGGDRRGGGRMGMRGGRGGPESMLQRADADSNGQVTKAEFQSAALARFDRADANGDGTISAEERKAARQAMRGERRGQ
ncbi:hypothetical protein WAB17_07205 [Parerythrobacter aurantius]|uniref:EF-hand domain-containing protein n=1 Tax=Parerythrobacter aurantius TaxID=3127706 RepID=UPI003249D460